MAYLLDSKAVLAQVHIVPGEEERAASIAQEAERLARKHRSSFEHEKAQLVLVRIWLWLRQGNLAAAARWADE